MPQKQPAPAWRSRDVLRVTALVIFAYAVAHLLWATRALVLTVLLGVLLGLAVGSGADRLVRYRVPRAVGAPLVVFTFLLLLAGFGTWIGPTVREQTTELRTRLPEALDKLERWIEDRGGGTLATVLGLEPSAGPAPAEPRPIEPTVEPPPPAGTQPIAGVRDAIDEPEPGDRRPDALLAEDDQRLTLRERVVEQLRGASRYFLPVLGSTLVVVGGIVLVVFLAIYVGVNPAVYRRGAMYMVPKELRPRVEHTLDALVLTLRRWLVTQLIAMVVIGILTTTVLLVLRVQAAVPLGILAGLLEFIPNIGPILSAVPAIAMGFVDSAEKALFVTVAYIGIQFLENQLLTPILMQERIHLPPALTLAAQAVMALVAGFMGLLLAVPILAIVVVSVRAWSTYGERAT